MNEDKPTSDTTRTDAGPGLSAEQLGFLNAKIAPQIGAMLGSLLGLTLFLTVMLSLPIGHPLSGSRPLDVTIALGLVACLGLGFAVRVVRLFPPRRI